MSEDRDILFKTSVNITIGDITQNEIEAIDILAKAIDNKTEYFNLKPNNKMTTRVLISTSPKKFRALQNGVSRLAIKEQVVYKTAIGKKKGKNIYRSQTRHEIRFIDK